MPYTKLLLRIILSALGIAAVVGALGILYARSTVIGQIDATLVLTAICCAFLLRVAKKSSEQEDALPLITSTALIALEFILGSIAIWSFDTHDQTAWAAVESMLAVAGSGIPAIVFLKIYKSPVTRVAAIAGLIVCAISLALWMTAIVLSWQDAADWNLALHGNVMGAYGVLTVVSLVGVGTDRWHWRWIGVLCAMVGGYTAIQYVRASGEWHTQPLLILTTISLLVGHANVSLRCPLKRNQRWLVYATIGAVAVACIFANLSAPDSNASIWDDRKGFDRLAGAAAVLGSCGTIALAILYRLNRGLRDRKKSPIELNTVTVICPVCARRQLIKGGEGSCTECGLVIHVQLTEPKCRACGYSLLMFTGKNCPECGAALTAK